MCALLKVAVNTVLTHLTLPIHCSKKLKHLTLRLVNFIPNAMITMLFKHIAFLYLSPKQQFLWSLGWNQSKSEPNQAFFC